MASQQAAVLADVFVKPFYKTGPNLQNFVLSRFFDSFLRF
jgi:hypothetical protein